MSVAARHADWLSLVEISGPFLTLPVLNRAFPAGLEPTDRELIEELRVAWTEVTADPSLSGRFVRWGLERLLGFGPAVLRNGPAIPRSLSSRVPEQAIELRPDYAVVDPERSEASGRARLLVAEWPWGTPLEKRPEGSSWSASPLDRAEELCRATGVRIGVVTNGETWALLDAPPGQASGTATWDAELWLDERSTLDAFTTLVGARRLFGVAAPDTLEALFDESANAEAEVTDQLGRQVKAAVELLIDAWSRANRERSGRLLADLSHSEIYEGALTVLMRLVFLLCAEERGLFLLGDDLYDATYAVSTLRAQLEEEANIYGEDVLERHMGAWSRLLATFRLVHGGARHPNLMVPAYGGGLFDPDRFPWLEGSFPGPTDGRARHEPMPVDDRTVFHLLDALQVLRFEGRGGAREARRVSFRTLEVEQIGHVYEGLLDHGVYGVDDVALGLSGKLEPELALSDLEVHASRGTYDLESFLAERTGATRARVSKALETEASPEQLSRLVSVCDNDHELAGRIAPFLGLLRSDLRGLPQVWLPGSVVVTRTGDRRSSGIYYTPRVLAEEMVRHALEPLVYQPGLAEGARPEDWQLRPATELLNLKVCDMAIGSGAFLVAACRYLGARLIEAWTLEGLRLADPVGPEGGQVELPSEESDREILALRMVADRCLYGVDRNPMAVEMAKLSLWLVTLAKDRPFSFVDHALRSGDSLLGITSLPQLEYLHLDSRKGAELFRGRLFDPTSELSPLIETAVRKRRELESFTVLDIADAEAKQRLFEDARADLERLRVVADVVVGATISTARGSTDDLENRLLSVARDVRAALRTEQSAEDRAVRLDDLSLKASYWLDEGRPELAPDRSCLHWPLEFPEVFLDRERPGFDAVVGNPPFQGGKRISGPYGPTYREHLVKAIADGRTGNADLVTYFFLRGSEVVREGGSIGLLATNTIAQGDTREVGLDWLTGHGWTVLRASKSRPWPGDASIEIAQVWLRRGQWKGGSILEGSQVSRITPALEPAGRVSGPTRRLAMNSGQSFIGSLVLGTGFVLNQEEAEALIRRDPRNGDVLFPYMNGEDLNSRPDGSTSRWIINFFDWPLERAEEYPDCIAIVRDRVKPQRDSLPDYKRRVREAWWKYEYVASALYAAIEGMERVLVIARISKTVQPALVANRTVFNEKTVVFAYNNNAHFGLLASTFHYWWTITHSSSLRTDLNYAPTDCFETFPQPEPTDAVDDAGGALDAYRREVMLERWEGLTATYNRVHDPKEEATDIAELRRLHMDLDHAVAAAYGWGDLVLDHDFWETRQGMRFTIGPEARTELLDRLLELNHARYAQEERLGLHQARAKAQSPGRRRRARTGASSTMFEVGS